MSKTTIEPYTGDMTRKVNVHDTHYVAVHKYLKHKYGKASKCENKDCPGISKNYNWAKLPGKLYEKKRENFIELCRSCHAKMDITEDGRKRLAKRYKENMQVRKVAINCKICGELLTQKRIRKTYCDNCHYKNWRRLNKEFIKKNWKELLAKQNAKDRAERARVRALKLQGLKVPEKYTLEWAKWKKETCGTCSRVNKPFCGLHAPRLTPLQD